MDPHLYHVDIVWSKDRKGMMCSPEVKVAAAAADGCIEVATL